MAGPACSFFMGVFRSYVDKKEVVALALERCCLLRVGCCSFALWASISLTPPPCDHEVPGSAFGAAGLENLSPG
jgi:hypothetical protein